MRKILDDNSLGYAKIFVSGDLDEFKITQLLNEGAKIDAFGVGTKMGTSETMTGPDSFSAIMKLSKDKITLPGRKQVYRFIGKDGTFRKDVIALADEKSEGEALLVKVMEKGKLVYSLPSIDEIRVRAAQSLSNLPLVYQKLTGPSVYPVYLSQNLQDLIEKTKGLLTKNEINNEPV